MGKRSRTKGAAAERELAALVRPVFPDARRRCSGEESQGVAQGRDLDGTPGFALQSCHAHAPPIYRKLSEAEGAAKADELPVAVTKRTGGRWIATMRLDDWLILVRLSFEALRADPRRGLLLDRGARARDARARGVARPRRAVRLEEVRRLLLRALEGRDLRRDVERLLVRLDRETSQERQEAHHDPRE